jgi:hypothetical protein
VDDNRSPTDENENGMKAAGSVMKAAGSVMKVRRYFLRRTLNVQVVAHRALLR